MNEPAKQYELTFEERPGYLYARVVASRIDEQMALAYLGEISRRCMTDRVERLMIYRDIPDVLGTTSMYFAATSLHKLLAGTKTAFVNPYAENDKILQFGTTVGFNSGEQHELFDDERKAERWLLSK